MKHFGLAMLLALLFASVGCDQGPSGGHAAMPPLAASFDFYKDGTLVDPVQWASVQSNGSQMEPSQALASLHINDVVIAGNNDEDPVDLLVKDLPTILAWGGTANPPGSMPWLAGHGSSKDDEFDYLSLPFSEPIFALNVGWYIGELRKCALDGRLDDHADATELADALFNIGYSVFQSSDTVGTATPRRLILGSAWDAAIQLRAREARERGDDERVEYWERQSESLLEFTKEYGALISDQPR